MSQRKEASWVSWERAGCALVLIPLPLAFLGYSSAMEAVEPRDEPGLAVPEGLVLTLILAVALLAAVLAAVLVARGDRAGNTAALIVVAGAAVLLLTVPPRLNELWEKRSTSIVVCLSNLKQIQLAQLMYAHDHGDHFPPAEHWPKGLQQYLRQDPECLVCPLDGRRQRQRDGEIETSYTMSDAFGDIHLDAVADPAQVGTFFDGTALYGQHEAVDFRHRQGANVAYADGHCKWVRQEDFGALRLEP